LKKKVKSSGLLVVCGNLTRTAMGKIALALLTGLIIWVVHIYFNSPRYSKVNRRKAGGIWFKLEVNTEFGSHIEWRQIQESERTYTGVFQGHPVLEVEDYNENV
jgi:hypothetical protein